MAVTRASKETELQELESAFRGTESAILVDYRGLKVPEVTELRRQVRGAQGRYKVIKNTLAIRAVKGTPFEPLTEHLVGTTAILQAAIARFFFLAATGGGPGARPGMGPPLPIASTMLPGFIVEALIVAAMIHDWRSYGRVHPAYWWGLGVTATVHLLRPVVGYTDAWYRAADFLVGFAG